MRHGTSCTVLPDRDGEGMPSPYGGRIVDAVGRLAVPRRCFSLCEKQIAHIVGDDSLRYG